MTRTRLLIEIGTGVELHGQDPTRAAAKAVRDAVSRVCFGMGLHETFKLGGHKNSIVSILVGVPHHEQVDKAEVLKMIPYGEREIQIVEGGMIAKGHFDPDAGDKSDDILIANAAITVLVNAESLPAGRGEIIFDGINGAGGRDRTGMRVAPQQFLRLSRLPIPPPRHEAK
jgi:uncharacterized protein (TIGR02058 family)